MLSREAYAHMKHPHGINQLSSIDLQGRSGDRHQGPFFTISIKLSQGKVEAASFQTFACPWANAIGSALCKMIETRSLDTIAFIDSAEIETALGGVPRAKRGLPGLAVAALKDALSGPSI